MLVKLTITRNNNAYGDGAGIYNQGSSPTLVSCSITANRTENSGGGMHNNQSSPSLIDCFIYNNTAGFSGGGILNEASSFTDIITGDLILVSNGSTCKALAYLSPNGNAPISGEITAKVWVQNTQPKNFLKRHYEITPATNAENAIASVTLYFTSRSSQISI